MKEYSTRETSVDKRAGENTTTPQSVREATERKIFCSQVVKQVWIHLYKCRENPRRVKEGGTIHIMLITMQKLKVAQIIL